MKNKDYNWKTIAKDTTLRTSWGKGQVRKHGFASQSRTKTKTKYSRNMEDSGIAARVLKSHCRFISLNERDNVFINDLNQLLSSSY